MGSGVLTLDKTMPKTQRATVNIMRTSKWNITCVRSDPRRSASQRDIRVNHGGPAGGNVARGAGYSEHQEKNGYVDGRIACIYVNETLNHPTQSQGDTDADGGGHAARSQSLQQEHSQHLPIRAAHPQ